MRQQSGQSGVLFRAETRNFYVFPKVQTGSLAWVPVMGGEGGVPFPGVKRLYREGDHSPPFRLWMSGTISLQLPPICVHEMDMNKYTVVEKCQHLQAELKEYDRSFHFRVQNLA